MPYADDLFSLTALKDYVAAHWPKTPGRAYDALQRELVLLLLDDPELRLSTTHADQLLSLRLPASERQALPPLATLLTGNSDLRRLFKLSPHPAVSNGSSAGMPSRPHVVRLDVLELQRELSTASSPRSKQQHAASFFATVQGGLEGLHGYSGLHGMASHNHGSYSFQDMTALQGSMLGTHYGNQSTRTQHNAHSGNGLALQTGQLLVAQSSLGHSPTCLDGSLSVSSGIAGPFPWGLSGAKPHLSRGPSSGGAGFTVGSAGTSLSGSANIWGPNGAAGLFGSAPRDGMVDPRFTELGIQGGFGSAWTTPVASLPGASPVHAPSPSATSAIGSLSEAAAAHQHASAPEQVQQHQVHPLDGSIAGMQSSRSFASLPGASDADSFFSVSPLMDGMCMSGSGKTEVPKEVASCWANAASENCGLGGNVLVSSLGRGRSSGPGLPDYAHSWQSSPPDVSSLRSAEAAWPRVVTRTKTTDAPATLSATIGTVVELSASGGSPGGSDEGEEGGQAIQLEMDSALEALIGFERANTPLAAAGSAAGMLARAGGVESAAHARAVGQPAAGVIAAAAGAAKAPAAAPAGGMGLGLQTAKSFAAVAVGGSSPATGAMRGGTGSTGALSAAALGLAGGVGMTRPGAGGVLPTAAARAPAAATSAATAAAAAAGHKLLSKLSARVRDEIVSLCRTVPGLKLDDFDDGVLYQLTTKRGEEEALAALHTLANDELNNIQHMAAYINHVIKNYNGAAGAGAGPSLPSATVRANSVPVSSKAILQKLPLRVYKRLEEIIAKCSYMEWKHFDAGVIKVLAQLAEISEEDVFEEMEQLLSTDLSNVEYMPAYLNKRLNNRLWSRRKLAAACGH